MYRSLASLEIWPYIVRHISIPNSKMRRPKLLLFLALPYPIRLERWLSHAGCYESNLHLRL